jgi:hypothetical protein
MKLRETGCTSVEIRKIFWSENLKGMHHVGDVGMHGRNILQWSSEK